MSDPRLIIIGAGVAGSIAARALASMSPRVFEAGPKRSCLDAHKAVMRLRDERAAMLLGVETEKVQATRQILWGGELHESCDVRMNNFYSLKVSGEIHKKSISNVGTVERLLIRGNVEPPENTEFDTALRAIDRVRDASSPKGVHTASFYHPRGVNYQETIREMILEYDIAISTIPLNKMAEMVGLNTEGASFNVSTISVFTGHLSIDSTVNQTIYVPEPEYKTYRATIEGRKVMFEATEEPSWDELDYLLKMFGIDSNMIEDPERGTQKAGKMSKIDDTLRRRLIYHLTDEFNIFSFGRFGIWKPIRTDEMVSDIEVIKRMIRVGAYQVQKERSRERE